MSSMVHLSLQRKAKVIQTMMAQNLGRNNHHHPFLVAHATPPAAVATRSLSVLLSSLAKNTSSTSSSSSLSSSTHRTFQIHNFQKEHHNIRVSSQNFSTDVQTQLKQNDASNSQNNSDNHQGRKNNIDPLRLIPTRHSSKYISAIAPVDILDNATDKILNSIPGTLFAYDPKYLQLSKEEEYQKGLESSHYHQEHVEYLLRGYSSLLPSSLVHLQESTLPTHPNKQEKHDIVMNNQLNYEQNQDGSKGEDIVNKMIQLINRMEEEGRVYVELRSKLRSQLMNVNQNENQNQNQNQQSNENDRGQDNNNDDDDDDNDYEVAEATIKNWHLTQLIHHYGAPPGPSTAMYDLTLDAISNIINDVPNPVSLLHTARTLHRSALKRNELDREQKLDTINVKSVPTAATFNAMIRTSSLVDNTNNGNQDEIRDVAVENAFIGYDAIFHHNVVERNSATYKYMVRTVNKFFPDCEAKGYILVTLWDKCTLQEKLLDEDIIRAFLEVNSEDCGDKFHPWVVSEIKDVFDEKKNGYGFPLKFSRNKKRRRYDRRLGVY